MSKRSSSDDSNYDSNSVEPKVKRKKIVEFEPVRICSISGVVSFFFKINYLVIFFYILERYR